MAEEEGVDLLMVVKDASPPVCRLVEYSRYKFEEEKKKKEERKKQKAGVMETKELKMRPNTGDADYNVRLKKALKFLEKNNRVKVTVSLRGREMQFKDLGKELIERFQEEVGDAARIEQAPTIQGNQITMLLAPARE
ncbi:unnamed protein product [Pedinophyceae sp. YPF-701]|nr:unnamed protein product [Pedinophyceae sp. YPF-701]